MTNKKPSTIDEYIKLYSEEVQTVLQKIRFIIKSNAPNAEETINYGIPTFKMNGNLVHFAAFKKHIGFYPTPAGIENFKNELVDYDHAKGSIKFPLAKPIPYDLIEKIVKYRVQEAEAFDEKTK